MLMLLAQTVQPETTVNKLLDPGVLAVVGVFLTMIVATVASYWASAHKVSQDSKLKLDMLERGMSADEIAKVIDAGREATDAEEMIKVMKAKQELKA